MRYYTTIASPIGDLLLLSDGDALCGVYMDAQKYRPEYQPDWQRHDKHFVEAKKQFKAYFARELTQFDLPLTFAGTTFQNKVWNGLLKIPFGQTWSYQALANHIKSPKAVRAVGLANGKNPLAIIIPCHRVIGSNGTLTGYGGGLPRKQWLLEHEAAQASIFS